MREVGTRKTEARIARMVEVRKAESGKRLVGNDARAIAPRVLPKKWNFLSFYRFSTAQAANSLNSIAQWVN